MTQRLGFLNVFFCAGLIVSTPVYAKKVRNFDYWKSDACSTEGLKRGEDCPFRSGEGRWPAGSRSWLGHVQDEVQDTGRYVTMWACGPQSTDCRVMGTYLVPARSKLPYCKDGQTQNCIFDPVGPCDRIDKSKCGR